MLFAFFMFFCWIFVGHGIVISLQTRHIIIEIISGDGRKVRTRSAVML